MARCGPARVALTLATLVLLAGCSSGIAAPSTDPAKDPSPSVVPSSAATAAVGRPTPPAGLPTMPDARPEPLPNDEGVAARWFVDRVGAAAYDYYRRALPAAGFALLGLYPTERSALIRFRSPDGAAWQLLAEQWGTGTRITLQEDRP